MSDISVIILTLNEEIHIRRCLENIKPVAKWIFVIDCFSKDRTVDIAKELGAEVYQHEWPGNQAAQFNWALENLPITTEWVLRLDADEYLTPELISEINEQLSKLSDNTTAVVFPLGRAFMGRVLKHGIVNSVKMIRLFRYGKACYEQRLMDEHIVVKSGRTVTFKNKFIDDNLLSVKQFIEKHNHYSSREAALLLDAEYHLFDLETDDVSYCEDVQKKRAQKLKYAKMPLFWRSFAYFCYRYIFRFGFLDGKEGFLWDFLQGWWYRTLVDAKIFEIKRACGKDLEKIKRYLKDNYQIKF